MNWTKVARMATERAQEFMDGRDCSCDDDWGDCWYRYTPAEKRDAMVVYVAFWLDLNADDLA